ncbi:NAD(P)/FAD-dependent oxidoreductase [Metabacillus sp. GX 13764]|uniref:FAD-dependent oxidoreductase n=1 Tax=Metabacillus kandeliae TaxID=2900151 RepID=UPI001E5E75AB|nr:FAD-dependent oxidoreductase [Metabacillus kandeliae]MCD7036315.1 NAD(P)/FAD-dependent oxidoreductase [Metabacillus kandeliae]
MENVLVIGGGIGGLTAAALLAKENFNVTVLEASNEWGGCAGKFTRGSYLFPAGATLGMGFESGGIHSRVFESLGMPFPHAKPLEEIMQIHFPGGSLSYKKDRKAYLKELEKLFPENMTSIESFFEEVWQIGKEVRSMLGPLPALPPKTVKEWIGAMGSLKPGTARLLPYLHAPFGKLIKKHGLEELQDFLHLLDAQLIDSMQTTAEDCSAVIGAYALSIYHDGAFYVEGGLYQIAEALQKAAENSGAEMLKRKWVTSIKKEGSTFIAADRKGQTWEADHVVCNLPLQSFLNLLDEPLKKQCSSSYKKKAPISQWGTMTLYLAIDENVLPENPPLFAQVLQSDTGDMAEGEHLFLSLSAQGDRIRAPLGIRTMTVSTHTSLDRWKTKEDYDHYKPQLKAKMMKGIKQLFPRIEEGILQELPGAPKAWERFTKRPDGMVGGFPQTLDHALFNSLSHRTGVKNLYLCGDSVFPGAGTVGVSVSGIHVYRSISGKWGGV